MIRIRFEQFRDQPYALTASSLFIQRLAGKDLAFNVTLEGSVVLLLKRALVNKELIDKAAKGPHVYRGAEVGALLVVPQVTIFRCHVLDCPACRVWIRNGLADTLRKAEVTYFDFPCWSLGRDEDVLSTLRGKPTSLE